MSTGRGSTIASRIARFYEAPPVPKEQRQDGENKFWWQDRPSNAGVRSSLLSPGKLQPGSDLHATDQRTKTGASPSSPTSRAASELPQTPSAASPAPAAPAPSSHVLSLLENLSITNPGLVSALSHIERDASGRLSSSTLARISQVLATGDPPCSPAQAYPGSSAPPSGIAAPRGREGLPGTRHSHGSGVTRGSLETLDTEDSSDSLAAAIARYRQQPQAVPPPQPAARSTHHHASQSPLNPRAVGTQPAARPPTMVASTHVGLPSHPQAAAIAQAPAARPPQPDHPSLSKPRTASQDSFTFAAPTQVPAATAVGLATTGATTSSPTAAHPAVTHAPVGTAGTGAPASGMPAAAGQQPGRSIAQPAVGVSNVSPFVKPAADQAATSPAVVATPNSGPQAAAPTATSQSVAVSNSPVATTGQGASSQPTTAPSQVPAAAAVDPVNNTHRQVASDAAATTPLSTAPAVPAAVKPGSVPATSASGATQPISKVPEAVSKAPELTTEVSLAALPSPGSSATAASDNATQPQQPKASSGRPAHSNTPAAQTMSPGAGVSCPPEPEGTQPRSRSSSPTRTASGSKEGLPPPPQHLEKVYKLAVGVAAPATAGNVTGSTPQPSSGTAQAPAVTDVAAAPVLAPAGAPAQSPPPAPALPAPPVLHSAATPAAPAPATGTSASNSAPVTALPASGGKASPPASAPTGPTNASSAAQTPSTPSPPATANPLPPPPLPSPLPTDKVAPTSPATQAGGGVSSSSSAAAAPAASSRPSPPPTTASSPRPDNVTLGNGTLDVSKGWPAAVLHGTPVVLPGTSGVRPPMIFVPAVGPSPTVSRSPSPDPLYSPTHVFVPAQPGLPPQLLSLPGHPSYPLPPTRSPSASPPRAAGKPPATSPQSSTGGPVPLAPAAATITFSPTQGQPGTGATPAVQPAGDSGGMGPPRVPAPAAPAGADTGKPAAAAVQPASVSASVPQQPQPPPAAAPVAPVAGQAVAGASPVSPVPNKDTCSAPHAGSGPARPAAAVASTGQPGAGSAPAPAAASPAPAAAKKPDAKADDKPTESEAARRAHDVLELEAKSHPATRLTRLVNEVEAARRKAKEEAIRREEKAKLQKMKWDELEGYLGTQATAVQDIRKLKWDNTTLTKELGPVPPKKLATQFLEKAEAMRSAAIGAAVERQLEREAHREELERRDAEHYHSLLDMQHTLGMMSHRHTLDKVQMAGEAAKVLIESQEPHNKYLTQTYWSRSAGSSPSRPLTSTLSATAGLSPSSPLAQPDWYKQLLMQASIAHRGAGGSQVSSDASSSSDSDSSSSDSSSESDSADQAGGSAQKSKKGGKRKDARRKKTSSKGPCKEPDTPMAGGGVESITAAARSISVQLDSALSRFIQQTAGVTSSHHFPAAAGRSRSPSPRGRAAHATTPSPVFAGHTTHRVYPPAGLHPLHMGAGDPGLTQTLLLVQQQAIAAQQAALQAQQRAMEQQRLAEQQRTTEHQHMMELQHLAASVDAQVSGTAPQGTATSTQTSPRPSPEPQSASQPPPVQQLNPNDPAQPCEHETGPEQQHGRPLLSNHVPQSCADPWSVRAAVGSPGANNPAYVPSASVPAAALDRSPSPTRTQLVQPVQGAAATVQANNMHKPAGVTSGQLTSPASTTTPGAVPPQPAREAALAVVQAPGAHPCAATDTPVSRGTHPAASGAPTLTASVPPGPAPVVHGPAPVASTLVGMVSPGVPAGLQPQATVTAVPPQLLPVTQQLHSMVPATPIMPPAVEPAGSISGLTQLVPAEAPPGTMYVAPPITSTMATLSMMAPQPLYASWPGLGVLPGQDLPMLVHSPGPWHTAQQHTALPAGTATHSPGLPNHVSPVSTGRPVQGAGAPLGGVIPLGPAAMADGMVGRGVGAGVQHAVEHSPTRHRPSSMDNPAGVAAGDPGPDGCIRQHAGEESIAGTGGAHRSGQTAVASVEHPAASSQKVWAANAAVPGGQQQPPVQQSAMQPSVPVPPASAVPSAQLAQSPGLPQAPAYMSTHSPLQHTSSVTRLGPGRPWSHSMQPQMTGSTAQVQPSPQPHGSELPRQLHGSPLQPAHYYAAIRQPHHVQEVLPGVPRPPHPYAVGQSVGWPHLQPGVGPGTQQLPSWIQSATAPQQQVPAAVQWAQLGTVAGQVRLEDQARVWAAGQGLQLPSPPVQLQPAGAGADWSWRLAGGATPVTAPLDDQVVRTTQLQLDAVYGTGVVPFEF